MSESKKKYLALAGGVGGAKLALGLARYLAPEQLTVVANTADDFEHLGLHISPDLDSVMYALACLNDPVRGWGLANETWSFMSAVEQLGGDAWFRLGDKDIATHVLRTQALRSGLTLTQVTRSLRQRLGILHELLPMSDDPVRTQVHTDEGVLPFQHYFVRRQCEPAVAGFEFEGIDEAAPQADFMQALADPDLGGIVICPSNPFVSIDPIIRMPGVRAAIQKSDATVIAVSPIVSGKAIKGPAAKMLRELGRSVSATAVAEHYNGLVDCFVVDQSDHELGADIKALGFRVVAAATVMKSVDDKVALARRVIELLAVR